MSLRPDLALLRIPPFPGHRAGALARPGTSACDPAELVSALNRERVGGQFWGKEAVLPDGTGLVLAPQTSAQLSEMLALAGTMQTVILECPGVRAPAGHAAVAATSDPWSLARRASEIWAGAGHELAPIAAWAGTSVRLFGDGAYARCVRDPLGVVAQTVSQWAYASPYDTAPCGALEAVALLGAWRNLIDRNKRIAAVHGVARWKRVTLDAMLWDGTGPVRHMNRVVEQGCSDRAVALWKSHTPRARLAGLEAQGVQLAEIEDGFIRSIGLGANCVPPLSAIVDFAGIYFDPSGHSDLEQLLEHSEIDSTLCQRASALRARLVDTSISKYGIGGTSVIRQHNAGRRVLVTGQVEDDRSIISGGSGTANLQLLERARALEPDAWLVYKPHPDVEAGHREGLVPAAQALRFADEVASNAPIIPLIESADALHVITSLAGFEALLRGKPVTTHGVPFYAGWGLTRDLAPVSPRRTRRRSLDQLVAATLILYPRYLDPVTRLPCPPEVLVERMAVGDSRVSSPLVFLRELQGKVQHAWAQLTGGAR